MPLKSLFLPKEALQGEDIPSHIIWDDIDYSQIQVKLPPTVKVKEVYNVREGEWEFLESVLSIKSPEVEGYVGLLFSSIKCPEPACDYSFEYLFLNEKDEIVINRIKNIHLFRPQISIVSCPTDLVIDNPKQPVFNVIKLKNVGKGTAIIRFDASGESEVSLDVSSEVDQFQKGFQIDIKEELSILKKGFSQYLTFLDNAIEIFGSTFDPDDEEYISRMKKFEERLPSLFETDRDFMEHFAKAVVIAIFRNLRVITRFENLLAYLHSIKKRKIHLLNPLDIVRIPKSKKKLQMEVRYFDLLYDKYSPVILPPIGVLSKEEIEIPMYELFEWL